jgi:hypothetical protein
MIQNAKAQLRYQFSFHAVHAVHSRSPSMTRTIKRLLLQVLDTTSPGSVILSTGPCKPYKLEFDHGITHT